MWKLQCRVDWLPEGAWNGGWQGQERGLHGGDGERVGKGSQKPLQPGVQDSGLLHSTKWHCVASGSDPSLPLSSVPTALTKT